MDKQSGSSSNFGQVNPPLTDKQCAYCARTGDLNLKCFCEIMSLPPMFYCSVACLLDHRHDAKRQHICGSGRAKPPAGASSSSKSGQKAVDLPSLIDIDDTTARGPCAFCRKEGKKICGPCGGENSRPTFYCSIACQFTDFPVHTHACGLEYPRNVDPMNVNLRSICCMYFPPNEQVPAEEENPKPRIFQIDIRLDIHDSSPHGFRFEGSTLRNLMGTDSVTSNLYNSFISGNATVVSESHYLLIVHRTDFKSDPSGMNRCLKHCADGLIQAPCNGPVLVLKFMGTEPDPARCVDVEPSDIREILTFFYPPFEDNKKK